MSKNIDKEYQVLRGKIKSEPFQIDLIMIRDFFNIQTVNYKTQEEVDIMIFECHVRARIPKECEGLIKEIPSKDFIDNIEGIHENMVRYKKYGFFSVDLYRHTKYLINKVEEIAREGLSSKKICELYTEMVIYFKDCNKYEDVDQELLKALLSVVNSKGGTKDVDKDMCKECTQKSACLKHQKYYR